jgi:hypothetical protein
VAAKPSAGEPVKPPTSRRSVPWSRASAMFSNPRRRSCYGGALGGVNVRRNSRTDTCRRAPRRGSWTRAASARFNWRGRRWLIC